MTGTRRRTAQLVLWGVVIFLALQFALFTLESATQQTGGFGAYYAAAHVVASDAETIRLYDDNWFQRQIDETGLTIRDIYRPNPPTTAVLLRPLASLDHDPARVIWTVLSLVAVFASIAVVVWLTGLRGLWIPAILALVLIYQPLLANVDQAQAYGLLFGLLTLAWYGYREERYRLFGILLGLIFAFKTLGVIIWGILVIERRWWAIAWGCCALVGVLLLSLTRVDLDTWRAYGEQLVRLGDRPELAVTAYQTQSGLIRQLLASDPNWNPEPIADAPAAVFLLAMVSTVVVLLVSGHGAYWSGDRDLTFALAVIITVFLSPLSLDYHYTLLLLPIVILIARSATQPSSWWFRIVLLVAIILIAADLPYQSPRLANGVWALFAYPKL
jgi:hypothetical protein